MCERKPGPRCSADTSATLRKAETDLAAAKVEYEKAYSPSVTLIDINATQEEFDTFNAAAKAYREAETNFITAQHNFYATPEGLKQLLAESRTGEVQEIEDQALITQDWSDGSGYDASDYDDFDYGPEYAAVKFNVPESELKKGTYKVAREHRSWQQKISKILAQDETDNPTKALFMAESFLSHVEDEIDEHRQGKQQYNYESALTAYSQDKSTENEKVLVREYIKYMTLDTESIFNILKRSDLEAYISGLKKRLA